MCCSLSDEAIADGNTIDASTRMTTIVEHKNRTETVQELADKN